MKDVVLNSYHYLLYSENVDETEGDKKSNVFWIIFDKIEEMRTNS